MSQAVREVMTQMPHTIGHDMGIEKAKSMMNQYSCHHLPVLEGGRLVGIISDRDLRTVEKVKAKSAIKIEDIMTDEPVVVKPVDDIFQVAMLMHEKKIGSVVVSASEGQPWGIFTSTDALAFLSKKK